MFSHRTLKILSALFTAYALLVIPAYFGPGFLEGTSIYFAIAPLLSLYVFHKLGVPGLLEHNGACGWGWCSPTAFGWVFLVLLWLSVFWLIAAGLARLTQRHTGSPPSRG
jgi:hypothetical protein